MFLNCPMLGAPKKGNYEFDSGAGWVPAAPPPTLIRSSLDPRFTIAIEPAQTTAAPAAPSPASPGMIVQNPDGSLSVLPVTTSTMPPAAPALLDSDPGGTSGFLVDSQTANAQSGGDVQPSRAGFGIIAGVALLLVFLGSR